MWEIVQMSQNCIKKLGSHTLVGNMKLMVCNYGLDHSGSQPFIASLGLLWFLYSPCIHFLLSLTSNYF